MTINNLKSPINIKKLNANLENIKRAASDTGTPLANIKEDEDNTKIDIGNGGFAAEIAVAQAMKKQDNEQKFKGTPGKLSVEDAYNAWKLDPSDDNFKTVMSAVRPSVNYALASYQGAGNPYVETQAKILAARAIKTYDPKYNVGLPTYLSSQLRKLTRIVRDATNPIKIPERAAYEIAELKEAEKDLLEKNGGKEPDVQQLADYMGVPISKIEKIRKNIIKQVSEGSYFNSDAIDEGDNDSANSLENTNKNDVDFSNEALIYIHNGADYRTKKILEWTTGYGGSKILTPAEISDKLGMSQSQVSRTAQKLAGQLAENIAALEEVYGGH